LIDREYSMKLAASQNGEPIYLLNLMKYRTEADYGTAGTRGISGRDTDCRYAPFGALTAAGASVCFLADVLAGRGGWDRVGVVRYPTGQSVMRMLAQHDFREWQVHREAGMERSIVMGTRPVDGLPPEPGAGLVLLEVWAGLAPQRLIASAADSFDVDGTIVGDGRQWTGARYTVIEPGTPLPLELPRRLDYQALLLEPRIVRWQ
jgi:hypothetical protein